MLGAAALYLRAEKNGILPVFTGRVMHGVFFRTLKNISPELADFVHDELSVKPFSLSELVRLKRYSFHVGNFQVSRGDLFRWRIAAVNDVILNAIVNIPSGYRFQVNKIPMVLEKIIVDGDLEKDTGIMSVENLMAACFSMDDIRSICVKFTSHTTFRVNQSDYPMPVPKLVFSSLADKWQKAGMPANIDKEQIREMSERVYLSDWKGRSDRVYLSGDRGVKTFTGEFVYELSDLTIEERQIMLLLAQFGCFVGCGRMTGQGLGQIEIEVR